MVKQVTLDTDRVRYLVTRRVEALKEAEDCRNELISLLGETAEEGLIAGSQTVWALRYKPIRQTTFSSAKLKKAYPELYEQFVTRSTRMQLYVNKRALGLTGDESGDEAAW